MMVFKREKMFVIATKNVCVSMCMCETYKKCMCLKKKTPPDY